MPEYNGHYYRETYSWQEKQCANCGCIIFPEQHYLEDSSASYKALCSMRCLKEFADMSPRNTDTGNCFITTATCKSSNLPDDCHELTALRGFRDSFMKKDPHMKAEVEEYYKIAPTICSNINKQANADEIYDYIRNEYLTSAVSAVDSNNLQQAHDIYKKMVLELKKKYYK